MIVNPIAGMGGKVGLKGTDGPEILERAIRLGAIPVAPERAVEALRTLRTYTTSSVKLITCSQKRGEESAKEAGLNPEIINRTSSRRTTSDDTKREIGRAHV